MMCLSVRPVDQNVTTYITLSKIQTLLSVMNQSRTYQKVSILYLIYLIAFLSDFRFKMKEINDIDATLSASNNQEENEQSSDVTSGTAQNELPALVVYDNTGSSDQGCELEAFLIEFKFEFKFTKICKFEFKFEFFKFQFFEFEFEFTK